MHKTPLAVHEILDKKVINGDAEREKYFKKDDKIHPDKFAVSNSYYDKTSAYKVHHFYRGHMAAAGNYSGDQKMKT